MWTRYDATTGHVEQNTGWLLNAPCHHLVLVSKSKSGRCPMTYLQIPTLWSVLVCQQLDKPISKKCRYCNCARMQHIILLKDNVLHLSKVSPSVQRRHIVVVCFVSILQKPWLPSYISQLYPPQKWKRGIAGSSLVCTFFWQHIPDLVILLLLSRYPIRGTVRSQSVCTFFWRHVPAPVIPLSH